MTQHGINKPKTYIDGMVGWCMTTTREEPSTMDDALHDPN
jgi:hypothetical protein